MKRLFTLLFTAIVVFALAMPVFAQDTSQQTTQTTKKMKKMKMKKTKKEKKMEKTTEAPPPSQ